MGGTTGTLVGGATLGNGLAYISSTTGQYVNLAAGLFGSYTSVSVELWVNTPSSNGNLARLFSWGASTTGSDQNSFMVARASGSNVLLFGYAASTTATFQLCTSTASFDGQSSMHVVLTVTQGGYAYLYKNGVLVCSSSFLITNLPPPTAFYVGNNMYATNGYGLSGGSFDEFRLYGGVLSGAEVLSNYNEGKGNLFVN